MPLKIGVVLVALMVLLQAFYAVYALIDPQGFALLRGTDLYHAGDVDWVQIYASRTLFVSLVVGILLYLRQYKTLVWVALAGAVMPITDAWLAQQASAPLKVVIKHIATVAYLLITAGLLAHASKQHNA